MALNLSFLNKVFSSAPVSGKVAWPGLAAFISSTVTQLIHQYAPSVQLPSQATMIALAGIVMTMVGYWVPHSGTAPKSIEVAPPAAPPAAPVNPPPANPPPGG